MYWSSPTRKRPESIGQHNVPAARTKTRTATKAGYRGAQSSEDADSGCNTRSTPREDEERDRGPDLGDGQQHPGRQGESGGGPDADRSLQHENEKPLSDAEASRDEKGEESREIGR